MFPPAPPEATVQDQGPVEGMPGPELIVGAGGECELLCVARGHAWVGRRNDDGLDGTCLIVSSMRNVWLPPHRIGDDELDHVLAGGGPCGGATAGRVCAVGTEAGASGLGEP